MDRLAEHYAHCDAALRENDRDRWLACLFAPDAARPQLFALYAFNAEVSRIRGHVSQPILGEMRLQWWLDALNEGPGGEARGDPRAHPVADALLATIAAKNLPRQPLCDLLEARRFDLYDDPAPDLHFLEAYCGETCSSLFLLAGLILGGTGGRDSAEAAGRAGCAYAFTGLLRAFPWHVANRQCYVPRDVLARHGLEPQNLFGREDSPALRAALAEMRALARDHLASARKVVAYLPEAERLAYRALSLPELYLCEMERKDYEPFKTLVEVAQWRRQWALWRGKI
ncbi:phytoene/squalene synthase family protein [uncultured Rhodoblastus sp.]|uniref:phytoene/squalene synthase family protein n=1 Tax=uncultured Rhodoblastus sp. TaxID=543037 RepID=UPI0025CDDEAC|nr:phytoene/squalene synthase family protein [uncultured Rhodoblastus sp.]